MKLEEIAKVIANERLEGVWSAHVLKILSMDAESDPALAHYISAASESHSLLFDELNALGATHPPNNNLDFVHFCIIRGNINIAFVFVYVVELWSSNYLAGVWEVVSDEGVDYENLEWISSDDAVRRSG